MTSFADALNTNASDVEAAPIMPVGTYQWEVIKDHEIRAAGEDWEVISWLVKCTGAEEDVDEDELEEFGSPVGEVARWEFMSPTASGKEGERGRQNTLNRIKKWLTDVLMIEESGTVGEMMAEAKGNHMLAQVTHRPQKSSGEMMVQLKGAAPID